MRPILILFLSAACAGCSIQPTIHDRYLFYDYAFSEKAEAAIRASAEATCKKRNLIPIRTEHVCGPSRCRASFQCVHETNAQELGLLPQPAK